MHKCIIVSSSEKAKEMAHSDIPCCRIIYLQQGISLLYLFYRPDSHACEGNGTTQYIEYIKAGIGKLPVPDRITIHPSVTYVLFKLLQEFGITLRMSKHEKPYDNALAKNCCGVWKSECTYRYKPRTLAAAEKLIAPYIYFDNHERIQSKTGVAPLPLRHSA